MLTIAAGKFGERWQDIYDAYAQALGLENIKINVPWGQAPTAAQVQEAIKSTGRVSVKDLHLLSSASLSWRTLPWVESGDRLRK